MKDGAMNWSKKPKDESVPAKVEKKEKAKVKVEAKEKPKEVKKAEAKPKETPVPEVKAEPVSPKVSLAPCPCARNDGHGGIEADSLARQTFRV